MKFRITYEDTWHNPITIILVCEVYSEVEKFVEKLRNVSKIEPLDEVAREIQDWYTTFHQNDDDYA